MFDWDGTAVPDRRADATRIRTLVEQASAHGLELAVVSGTHVGNVDGQLAARPRGPGGLVLALNRGSEVFSVDRERTAARLPAHRRPRRRTPPCPTPRGSTVERLAARGLARGSSSERLNRRKIDLIPEPEWEDPPKAQDRRAARCGRESPCRCRDRRAAGGGRDRPRRRRRGRTGRSTGDQRRQARRDRADRQVGLEPVDHALAVGARDRAGAGADRRR